MANASTVEEFSERYFTEVTAKGRKDATRLRRYPEKEIYSEFGNRPIRQITAQDICFSKEGQWLRVCHRATPRSPEACLRLCAGVWCGDHKPDRWDANSVHHPRTSRTRSLSLDELRSNEGKVSTARSRMPPPQLQPGISNELVVLEALTRHGELMHTHAVGFVLRRPLRVAENSERDR